MRKYCNIKSTVLLAVILAASACVKTSVEKPAEVSDYAGITYRVLDRDYGAPAKKTKASAAAAHKPFTQYDHFMSTAFFVPEGESFMVAEGQSKYGKYFDNVKITKDVTLGKWRPSETLLWPKNASLSFFSYAPDLHSAVNRYVYGENYGIDREGFYINGWNTASDPKTDILVADGVFDVTSDSAYPTDGCTAGEGGVHTVLHHIFSNLSVRAKKMDTAMGSYNPDDTDISVTKLEITNYYRTGSFRYGGYFWKGILYEEWFDLKDPVKEDEWTVLFDGSVSLGTDNLSSLVEDHYVLPQSMSRTYDAFGNVTKGRTRFRITYEADGGTPQSVEVLFRDDFRIDRWQIGKRHVLTFTISGGNYPIRFDVEVEDWEEAWNEDLEI